MNWLYKTRALLQKMDKTCCFLLRLLSFEIAKHENAFEYDVRLKFSLGYIDVTKKLPSWPQASLTPFTPKKKRWSSQRTTQPCHCTSGLGGLGGSTFSHMRHACCRPFLGPFWANLVGRFHVQRLQFSCRYLRSQKISHQNTNPDGLCNRMLG